MRKKVSFEVHDITSIKEALLAWSHRYYEVVWLDSNAHTSPYSSLDALLAVDALTSLKTDFHHAFEDLKTYQSETKDWIFGYLSYDLKNDIEKLSSTNYDGLEFPELYFFQPKKIIKIRGNTLEFDYLNMVADEITADFKAIGAQKPSIEKVHLVSKKEIAIQMRMTKDEYDSQISKILSHIHRGDLYEVNFCQEFYVEDTKIDPLEVYHKLNSISKAPFATFLKIENTHLLSASPERYLKKIGDKLISQPIKGTARRSNDPIEDAEFKKALAHDIKERSENIMIVDLVRNDLSKSAVKGSVAVEELCKIYTFNQVHQMISTVTAQVKAHTHPVDLIKESFPMGSMTGAPKISAMHIIEALETFKRGLYSGAVGYFTPDNDFDFNVVIRSIVYNDTKPYISFSVGSAITALSTPEFEYQECLLKAKAMRQVLE